MSTWRRLAVELFPHHRRGLSAFQRPDVSVYEVFIELLAEAKALHYADETEKLQPIYTFAEWCFAQRRRAPKIWNAAATAFYEHLADDDLLAEAIPFWVPEDIFIDMRDEFERRRERHGAGKFGRLLEHYNTVRGTNIR